jgi:hypothetical protein
MPVTKTRIPSRHLYGNPTPDRYTNTQGLKRDGIRIWCRQHKVLQPILSYRPLAKVCVLQCGCTRPLSI